MTVSCVVFGCLILLVGIAVLLNCYVAELRSNINDMVHKSDAVVVKQTDKPETQLAYNDSGKLENIPGQTVKSPDNKNSASADDPGMWGSMKNWARQYSWGKRWFRKLLLLTNRRQAQEPLPGNGWRNR